MKHMNKSLMVAVIISITLLGCSKVNRENYEKIKVGMDYQEVVTIIGEPDQCDSALMAKNCMWGNDSKNITVNFVADKVMLPTMTGL